MMKWLTRYRHIVRNEELDAAIFGEFLDLESTTLTVGEC